MVTVRSLLNILKRADRAAIDRLCGVRGVEPQVVAKCERLARSYRGDHEQLFQDLRPQDLRILLSNLTDGDGGSYRLPDATYSKSKLVRIALKCFREGELATELVRSDPEADAEEPDGPESCDEYEEEDSPDGLEVDDESEEESRDTDDAEEVLAVSDAGPFAFDFDVNAAQTRPHDYQRELTEALAVAVDQARPGKRLRITVATGGGKTRIANDWIWEHALKAKKRVLWITKDWRLLGQAAADLCQRRRGAMAKIGYVGGGQELAALDHTPHASVVYTTIHTWLKRKERDFRDVPFDAVVIDEAHWGEGKRSFGSLLKTYRQTTVFIELTATPRTGTRSTLVQPQYDYPKLAEMGVLARPIFEDPVQTRTKWSPERRSAHSDIDLRSLSKLAKKEARNRLIADTYVNGRDRFGKTLIFACNIQHAERIHALLVSPDRGMTAALVHSQMSPETLRSEIQRFRDGRARVLVNVAMMTHGVDIPDIETVFLARPTASKTLFAQMVGRAVRRTPTKSEFRLVDFVDTLPAHGMVLVSPTSYFGSIGSDVPRGTYRPAPSRSRHAFEKAKFEHIPRLEGYEDLAGFDIQPRQTFGIEFELTRDDFDGTPPSDWQGVADALLEALPVREKAARAYPEYHSNQKSHTVWNVEFDSSCGWEVTSRILEGSEGFFEVVDVCRKLDLAAQRLGMKLNWKTGTHVHLGWKPSLGTLRRLMFLVAYFEPALYTLVAPSRSRNQYCKPVRRSLRELLALPSLQDWAEHFSQDEHEHRRLTVNPSNLFGDERLDTIEVRMHSGTLEGLKILGWLSLWMRLLGAAEGTAPLPEGKNLFRDLPLSAGAQGDVGELADYVRAHRELKSYLRARREAVMERWLSHPVHGLKAAEVARGWA